MRLMLAVLLGSLFFCAGAAQANRITSRSAGGYGQFYVSGPEPSTPFETDLSQFEFGCSTDLPCDSDAGADPNTISGSLIIGVTTPVAAGTFTFELPSSFDDYWSVLTCAGGSQNNSGFSPCTTNTTPDSSCAPALNQDSSDVFTLTATSACPDATFVFDLAGTLTGSQLATPAGASAPEPGTLSFIFLGLVMLGLLRRRLPHSIA